jgi:uncharacterized metal-binding protein
MKCLLGEKDFAESISNAISKELYARNEKIKEIIEYFQNFSSILKTRKIGYSNNIILRENSSLSSEQLAELMSREFQTRLLTHSITRICYQ